MPAGDRCTRPETNEAPTVTCGASWNSSDGVGRPAWIGDSAHQRRIVGNPSIEDSGAADRETAGVPNR